MNHRKPPSLYQKHFAPFKNIFFLYQKNIFFRFFSFFRISEINDETRFNQLGFEM